MKREILTFDQRVSGCCPGHDKFPDDVYGSRRSIKARARGKQTEHQTVRARAKTSLRREVNDIVSVR